MSGLFQKASDNDRVYIIQCTKNAKKFFFMEFAYLGSSIVQQIIWTPRMGAAHLFLTEETVEEFKADFISPRKASIIRLPARDILGVII